MVFIKLWLKWAFNRSAYQILMGRYLDRIQPQMGRFDRMRVDTIIEQTWQKLEQMLPGAQLDQLKTMGNRQNVFLAVVTLAAYRSFLEAGVEKEYATELISDIAWKVYLSWIPLPRFIARLVTRDPQEQMNFILRIFLRYPFSPPGYQREFWAEPDGYCTYWFRCAPYEYFREHGSSEEIMFFNKTWCTFDWAVAQEMVEGGHYERPHTLSAGDEVCDMKWYGRPA